MNEAQKKKRAFRNSSKWKKFKHFKNVEQKGLCYISHKKILKGATLHHLDLDESHYSDISKPENFVYVNKSIHEVIHVIWRYYKNDPAVLDRIKEVLDRMLEINSPPPFEKENN